MVWFTSTFPGLPTPHPLLKTNFVRINDLSFSISFMSMSIDHWLVAKAPFVHTVA